MARGNGFDELSSVVLVQQLKSADFDIASRRTAVGLCRLRPAPLWVAAIRIRSLTRAPEVVGRAALQALFIDSPKFRSSRAEVSFSRLAVFRFMHDVLGCADVAARGRSARRISVILSDLALAHQIAPAGDRFVITAYRGGSSDAAA